MAGLPETTTETLIANPEPRLTATGALVAHHPSALITSFGYLHGPGPDAEITIDVRTHLRDPHSDPHLRQLTGHDPLVRTQVLATPGALGLIEGLTTATSALLQGATATGHHLVRVALGCAGGRHRSVVLAEAITERLALAGWATTALHLDIHQALVTHPTPTPED
jgi:RNase adaptor protein for sRNA GlmZ degradation